MPALPLSPALPALPSRGAAAPPAPPQCRLWAASPPPFFRPAVPPSAPRSARPPPFWGRAVPLRGAAVWLRGAGSAWVGGRPRRGAAGAAADRPIGCWLAARGPAVRSGWVRSPFGLISADGLALVSDWLQLRAGVVAGWLQCLLAPVSAGLWGWPLGSFFAISKNVCIFAAVSLTNLKYKSYGNH